MSQDNINLAIVDDDKLVVELLSDVFQQQDNFTVVTKAFSGNSFLRQLEELDKMPDIVLLDLRMEDGNGLEVIDVVTKKYSQLKIIVLTSFYKISFLGQMLKLGVHAFLPKEIDQEELLEVIQEVYYKDHFFTSDQIQTLRHQINHTAPKLQINTKNTLSARELEVLQLICQQYTAREIAEQLFVTTKTIEAHKSNLLLKTGVRNTAGLIIYAIENKLIDPTDLILLD